MKGLISGAVVAVAMLVVSGDVAKADHFSPYGGLSYGRTYYQPSYVYRPSYVYTQPSYGYSSFGQRSFGYGQPSYGFGYSRPGFSLSIGRGFSIGSGYSRSYGSSHRGHHHH